MPKVLFLALSINPEILKSHFAGSFYHINENFTCLESKDNEGITISAIVYTQGFDFEETIDNVTFIRDDTMYNKGFTISEIRDYFTQKAIKEYHPDYILHCDDDFKFREHSLHSVLKDVRYFEKNPDVGLSCMHYHKGYDAYSQPYDFNPSRVATRSGILFRVSAYQGWGGEHKIQYFEECYLATMIYKQGYRVIHTTSSTIHKTKPTGLGLSLERKYGKNNIPRSGRQILCDQGLLIPSKGKDSGGNEYLRYDVPLRVSESLKKFHEEGLISRI